MSQRANILLVDDQPKNLVALEAMLEDMDVNLVMAESGMKALKHLLDEEFAVVLLDVQMPEMDGFETARLIRQREKARDTPIIFVTALSRNESNVYRGYSLGAVDYLFKPIVPEILKSKVAVFVDLFRKSQELRQQTEEFAALSRRNKLLLDSVAEGVIGVDAEGIATFANPAASQMTAYSVDEIVGHEIHPLLHPTDYTHRPDDTGDTCLLEASMLSARRRFVEDDVFWTSKSVGFPVEYTATPIVDAEGRANGAVITFRDVTERRAAAMAAENERRYREAEAANRAKDEFLAMLSHELRTPMTAILGWVRMLRMGDLDPESTETAVDAIERSTSLQAQLIEDILDVSRIVTGKMRLKKEPIDLVKSLEQAVETVRHTAEDRQIRLTAEVEGEIPELQGDGGRLQQVFWNLLSNAIKFTPDGGQVTAHLRREDGDLVVEVRDSGQGIDKEFLPFVFERFRQANSTESRPHGGLGLGLAIVKHLAQLHGGTVGADSEGEGKGAVFTVRLPLEPAEGDEDADALIIPSPDAQDATDTADDREALAGTRLLVVEDDSSIRRFLVAILRRSGADITAVESVRAAFETLREFHPDLIISDIAMPEEDGIAFIGRIRNHADRALSTIPTIALTAFGREQERRRILDAGFDRHLAKPIDPKDLVWAIRSLLAERRTPPAQQIIS